MIDWKEQEPETELSINHLKLSLDHFKARSNLFWYRLKPALIILHALVVHNLVRHQDLQEKSLSFLCCTFLKTGESLALVAYKTCNEGTVAIK